MRASVNKAASNSGCYKRLKLGYSIRERHVKLYHILLIGAIAGMTLVHGIVLFKIDAGVRSGDATTTVASRSRKAYW
jgi:hypothetical protein